MSRLQVRRTLGICLAISPLPFLGASANAQGLPVCAGSDAPSAVTLASVPSKVTAGRWFPTRWTYDEDTLLSGVISYVDEAGKTFYSAGVTRDSYEDEDSSGRANVRMMELDAGETGRVHARWTQNSWLVDHDVFEKIPGSDFQCAGEATTRVITAARRPIHATPLAVEAGYPDTTLSIGHETDAGCAGESSAPIRISIRRPGKRARRVTLDMGCGEWKGPLKRRVEGLRVTLDHGDYGSVASINFRPIGTRGDFRREYRVTLRRGSATIGRFRLTHIVDDDDGDKDVYEGTDEFINYCINENRPIYSRNGRLYCHRVDSLYREARLLRLD